MYATFALQSARSRGGVFLCSPTIQNGCNITESTDDIAQIKPETEFYHNKRRKGSLIPGPGGLKVSSQVGEQTDFLLVDKVHDMGVHYSILNTSLGHISQVAGHLLSLKIKYGTADMMSMRYGPVELSVPPGFQNILRLISHEVLRVKPANTMEFIAGFLDDLLAIREDSGYDPVTQGDMIERVQERYWKVQRERNKGRLNETAVEKADKKPDINGGSGDTVEAMASVSEEAEALVTIATHQENGEGIGQDRPYQVAMVEEPLTEEHGAAPEEEQESVGDTITEEGGQDENQDEEQDQDMESADEHVTTVTEEDERPPDEAVEEVGEERAQQEEETGGENEKTAGGD